MPVSAATFGADNLLAFWRARINPRTNFGEAFREHALLKEGVGPRPGIRGDGAMMIIVEPCWCEGFPRYSSYILELKRTSPFPFGRIAAVAVLPVVPEVLANNAPLVVGWHRRSSLSLRSDHCNILVLIPVASFEGRGVIIHPLLDHVRNFSIPFYSADVSRGCSACTSCVIGARAVPAPLELIVSPMYVLQKSDPEALWFAALIVDVHTISIVFAPLADLAGCLRSSGITLEGIVVPRTLIRPMEFASAIAVLVLWDFFGVALLSSVTLKAAPGAWAAAVLILISILILVLILAVVPVLVVLSELVILLHSVLLPTGLL